MFYRRPFPGGGAASHETKGLQLLVGSRSSAKGSVADKKILSYFNGCVTGLVLLLASANTDSSEIWPAFQSENKKLTGSNTTLLIEARCQGPGNEMLL